MTDFVNILSNFGFPVAVACYLLFRFEKKLDNLNASIQKMSEMLNDNNEIVKGCAGSRRR